MAVVLDYKEFDLEITRGPDDTYRASITRSPAGEAAEVFRAPFEKTEQENFLLKLGPTRRGIRRGPSRESSVAEAFGSRLFAQVFCGKVGERFAACLNQVDTKAIPGLRISLRLIDVPELASLPWEFLFHPERRFIALSQRTPIVRYIDLPRPVAPLPVAAPLHVLTVVSSPRDYATLDVEREKANVRSALGDLVERGMVVGEILEPATLSALQQRLRRGDVHVLHFIGHGSWNPESEVGSLVFETPDRLGREIDANTLATLLCDHDPLRLVVLNACEGAKSSSADPYAGMAATLVRYGIPAVVAMQFEISDDAAVQLSQVFYQAIADGYPAEAALAEARKALYGSGNQVEWGTPVLFSRSPDGRLFDLSQSKGEAREDFGGQSLASLPGAMDDLGATKTVTNPSVGRFSAKQVKTSREQELEDKIDQLEKAVIALTLEKGEIMKQSPGKR